MEIAVAVAIVVLGVAFQVIFRPQIAGLIGRIRGISKQGVEIGPEERQSLEKKRQEDVAELMEMGNFPSLKRQEGFIQEGLKQKGLTVDSDTARVLLRHLAASQMRLHFELTYGAIFGTQIALLRLLHTRGGMTRAEIEAHFQTAQNVWKSAPQTPPDWNVDTYLKFLFSMNMIQAEGTRIVATEAAADFLVWMVRAGRTEQRPL
jgi:hypothetical protein